MSGPLLALFFFSLPALLSATSYAPHSAQLLSSSSASLSLVSGLTARMQCSLYWCGSGPPPKLCWYKDDVLLFNGTEFEPTSGIEPSKIMLQRTVAPDSPGVEDVNCVGDDYTLLVRNLSMADMGEFSCRLEGLPQQLDFHLDVLESGLKVNFNENYTYDHSECCIEKGVSPLCRPMCKPRDMHLEFFDPTSFICHIDDYKHFLSCATDGGKRDYVPCCRQKAVPSFCFDFCSNNKFQMLKKSHRLCLYYLPEIFDCFSKQYVLYPPSAPKDLRLKQTNTARGKKQVRKLCWTGSAQQQPSWSRMERINFSVHLREMPETALGPIANIGLADEGINRRMKRSGSGDSTVTLVQELQKHEAQFLKLDARNVEWVKGSNSETCVPLDNAIRAGRRYLVVVTASNDHGTSDPSQPFFIST